MDVVMCSSPWIKNWNIACLVWYQMTIEIIKYDIKIFMVYCRRSRHKGRSWNSLKKPKLVHDPLRQMWIHQAWTTSQPSRVEDYVFQGMCLRVTVVRGKAYVVNYSAVNKYRVWLYRSIPSERGKYASTWSIICIVYLRFPIGHVRKSETRSTSENGLY